MSISDTNGGAPYSLHPHNVQRLDMCVNEPFDTLRSRYEAAVPTLDLEAMAAFVARRASWTEVLADAAATATLGFLIFWRSDVLPLFQLAGETAACTSYLMGNHTIAQRMFHYHPSVMLYAPLKTVIYADASGTHFAVDQPSTVFSSFGQSEIADVGLELDRKLVALFEAINLPVPDVLRS